ncbi:hypothetical protein SRABI118_03735 [Massilia sp. Bi118]|uniref:hypothetical protein n=1 Tax=Massilia sp. Bi118 TaxID=2822346 RepID=UPI001DB313C2|nr:hypothetical protein [Massilia sp. Bi118]CAH0279555.1 hypothetical protein SRABI118_03735 [Massilia sp. Bi118]
MRPAALLLLAALAAGAHAAETPAPAPHSVEVNSIRNPEMRSYRSIWAGLDAFDEYRKMAPAAPLRFRVLGADGKPVATADGLALRLASDDGSTPVAIDAAGLVDIARSQAAYDADAYFILNQKRGRFSARPEIRTPGLPDNVRRLGDLRLECRVSVAIAKDQIPFLARAAINTMMLSTDWCGKKDMNASFPAGRELEGAVISHGGRSAELELESHRDSYMAPLGNPAWPDDALITLKYAAPAP